MLERPSRSRMAGARAIAAHWGLEGTTACQRCSEVCRAERAHLVDRALGGLDGPQNLALLCVTCHDSMPCFDVDQGAAAIAWLDTRSQWEWAGEIYEQAAQLYPEMLGRVKSGEVTTSTFAAEVVSLVKSSWTAVS